MNPDPTTLSLIAPQNYMEQSTIYQSKILNFTDKEKIAYENFLSIQNSKRSQKIVQMDHEFNARNIILLKKYKAQAEQKENEVKSRIRAQQNANMASFGLLKKLRIGFQHPTYLPNDQEMVKIRQITTEKQRIIGQAEEVKNLKIRRNIERIQQVKQEHIRNRSLKGEELKLENTRTVALIKNAKQTMLQDQEYVKNLKIRNQI